jgi:putative ABC transport system ATP-binding protein
VSGANGDTPIIELTDVAKVYRSGELSVEALRSISFAVGPGEFLAIMGPSGSGKTTVLGILGCLDRPTSGSYRLVGEEVAALGEARRAHVRGGRIGFVFQAYNLIPRTTAYKNVELPLVYAGVRRRERRRRVLEALAEVGLAARVDHLPTQLSGGEQQRVAIARALVVEPSVVLADEPTGNLDSASAEDVLNILERQNRRGATIVMVTHSSDVAERASRILRLADGHVVSDEVIGGALAAGAAR